ncbi:MAG TPA: hypothetical protein VJ844_09980 [Mucilaginibacter sp.]|nr:hypothetical protein [Mucilaginibacter sp.]
MSTNIKRAFNFHNLEKLNLTMTYQKIRGHKRLQKAVEDWRVENLSLRLDLLERYNYEYVKIIISPWCDISLTKSAFPEPKGKTKQLIINGLVDIYNSWKKQLDRTSQPYYLKIWIFEPRFSKSQVVCAIGNRIDYYNNLFTKPNADKHFRSGNYGKAKEKVETLTWEHGCDEDHVENDHVGAPEQYLTYNDFLETKKWFNETMKKPHRTTTLDDGRQYYSFKKGDVWVGSR